MAPRLLILLFPAVFPALLLTLSPPAGSAGRLTWALRGIAGIGFLLPGILLVLLSLAGVLPIRGALRAAVLIASLATLALGVSMAVERRFGVPAGPVAALALLSAMYSLTFLGGPAVDFFAAAVGNASWGVWLITHSSPPALVSWHGLGRDLFVEPGMYPSGSPVGSMYHHYPSWLSAAAYAALPGLLLVLLSRRPLPGRGSAPGDEASPRP